MLLPAEPVPPRKRGPQTPEGKARSAMNALKHGLRARGFALLPEEDPAEWDEHLADLRRCLAPADATEEKLVTALAVAMWKEVRADRAEAGAFTRMTDDPALGRDLGEKRNALSLGTAIRYATAAGMATQRAHRAFLAHRKAKQQGLIQPAAEPAAQSYTNELPPARPRPEPDPLAALRTRIHRLLKGAAPADPATHDLATAIRAARLPGAAPYEGPIDRALLDEALEPFRFDAAALGWLAEMGRPEPRRHMPQIVAA